MGADGKERPTTYTKPDSDPEPEAAQQQPGGQEAQDTETEEAQRETKLTREELAKLPPNAGMHQARLAVGHLEEIKPNDRRRKEAFHYVREWIDEHE